MHLTEAEVINFRSLKNVKIQIDPKTTLIVGRNNSGKTSFVNVFEKFFGGTDSRFVLEDFHTDKINDIKEAYHHFSEAKKLEEGSGEKENLLEKAYGHIPSIRLVLTIEYTEEDDLSPLAGVILDLDDECFEVKIEAALEVAKKPEFLEDLWTSGKRGTFDHTKWLRKKFSDYFAPNYRAVNAKNDATRKEIKRSEAEALLAPKFIYAQNKMDDTPTDRSRKLSHTFESYYNANSVIKERNESIEQIEEALEFVSKQLDENYATLFGPIFGDLQTFGFGTIAPVQKPRITSLMEAPKILSGSTRIQYTSGDNDFPLPESHNGLGYSKLIFTILQIIGFYQDYERAVPKPALQVLFIEEPEAHLHPQMQENFIKNIQDFINRKSGWKVQVVITTHSSHIVASSGFDTVRYFGYSDSQITVKNLSQFPETIEKAEDRDETLRFLLQYMALQRCDMLFADKVILIEGTTERLLLPQMIKICAEDLLHQYVSVIEVGGNYAYRFRDILKFLNVKTLIITDIDSVKPNKHRNACPPDHKSAITSNLTLKNWIPGKENIDELIKTEFAEKEQGNIRVAYQIPEGDSEPYTRSFEDAFITANATTLAHNFNRLTAAKTFRNAVGASPTPEKIKSEAYNISKKLSNRKTDFAFDIMLMDEWAVPRYIAEGLQWLS